MNALRSLLPSVALIFLASACAPRTVTTTAPIVDGVTITTTVHNPLEAPPAEEPEARADLAIGPMIGFTTLREVAIWAQLDRPGTLEVRYWPEGDATQAQRSRPYPATWDSERTVTAVIAALEPGTRYAYELIVDGQTIEAAHEQTFETQPLWKWRTDPPTFTAAFGSCFYVNEAAYDRPEDTWGIYGGEYEIFDAIHAADPDMMLWLGDNTYFREVDWGSRAGMAYRYAHDRSAIPQLAPLLANVAHYATWDDHDFGPNNSDRTFPLRADALELFQLFWANPSYGQPDLPGVFTQFQWADVEFFTVDDRYHRDSNNAPEETRVIYGREQLEWLLQALASSRAPFKIVASGGQMVNPHSPYEAFLHAPTEYEWFFGELESRGIEGVVFVAGDRHHGELLRLERAGSYPLYELTTSPLTAGGASASRELDNPIRVEGTLVNERRNFALIRVEGAREDRTLTIRMHGVDGSLIWEHAIHESELQLADE